MDNIYDATIQQIIKSDVSLKAIHETISDLCDVIEYYKKEVQSGKAKIGK